MLNSVVSYLGLLTGLKPGDGWCLCATRWREAMLAGVAPPVKAAATHEKALNFMTQAELEAHAVDAQCAN